jgi:hypothetical protein
VEQANTWKKFLVPILLAFCIQLTLPAQTTVRGRVVDGSTFEPVVFANVIFKGTVTGTQTNFDGFFILSGTSTDSISVSFIGYESRTLAIRTGIDQHVDVILQPALYSLQEVTVRPGENPALKLLRYFREHRRDHGPGKLSSYQYDNYSRTTVYIRSSRREKERGSGGLYAGEFGEFGITAGDKNIPAIPAYITESFSTSYFAGSPQRKYTRIKAVSSRGLAFENTELVSQLINRQEKIDMSENNVLIAGKSFISPVSSTGSLYYRYYLTDTAIIDNRYTCFEISVVPRRIEDPVFSGKLWIHDTTFALRRVSLEVTGKADINFISRIRIQQDFEPVEDGVWFPVRTRFLVDAANIFAANFSGKTNFTVNQVYDPGFFSSELKIDDDVSISEPGYWEKVRISSFDRTDSLATQRLDALRNDPKMKISAKLVEASVRGYYNFGKIDAGPWVMLYNYNDVEGSRIRIGGRTNQSFSRRLFMEGYLAAGSRDKSLKGSIFSEVFISRERWMRLGAMYRDDVERIGSIDEFYSGSSFLTFASSFGGSDKMNRSQVARTWLETDLLKGVSGKIFFTRKTFSPVSPEFIFAWYTNDERTSWSARFETSELGMSLRYQPKAVYVVDGMRRFPVDFNRYPVFSVSWIRGMDGFLGSDFSYNRLSAEISGNLGMGGLGRFGYNFIHTRVSDPLPYPLLINPAGNESVFLSGRTYNLMNYGEFAADNAYEMFTSWHMDGLLLNKIPLVKKLDLRTVLSVHCIAGSFDESRNGFYDPETNPSGILPPSVNGMPLTAFQPMSFKRPYAELAYGVENIFRFIRIDLVHRLTWLSNPEAQRLAVKLSGVFRF